MTRAFPDSAAALEFPVPEAPAPGEVRQIRDGLLWARLPLPYLLDHMNLYFLRDGAGWAVIDTGIQTAPSLAAWERLLDGPLRGLRLTQVIATHFHADHMGLAGWLCRRFGVPLLTSLTAYMTGKVQSLPLDEATVRHQAAFFESHGLDAQAARRLALKDQIYPTHVSPLPESYRRLLRGDLLTIGDRSFRVLSGDGHASEQIMLYCARDKLFFAADQVMEKVSGNITFPLGDNHGDPLGHFLRSMRGLPAAIPADVLVLPGHLRPFIGLHRRCAEIAQRHEDRCALILDGCRQAPVTVADLVPLLFPRVSDPLQTGFAFIETLAVVHRLFRRGQITTIKQGNRLMQVAASAGA